MPGDLILITGATGHLGFRVLRYALEYDYNVRAVVRSKAKAEAVRTNPVLKAMDKASQLSFTVVPDFLAPGAFDEAVKGVRYIIHVASPLPTRVGEGADFEKVLIEPAVRGTIGLYQAAQRAGTVERIVVTSSTLAIQPLSAFIPPGIDATIGPDSRLPEMPGPYPTPFAAYAASKIAAFNRSEAWVKETSPAFSVVNIHPSFIFGRDDMCFNTEDFLANGTNSFLLKPAISTAGSLGPLVNNFNNVNDAARVHVLALNPEKVKGSQSYIVSSAGDDAYLYNKVNEIVARRFPEAVKDGRLPNGGKYDTLVAKVDNSKTEGTFGKLTGLEETVVSVVGHWLELLEKEKAGARN